MYRFDDGAPASIDDVEAHHDALHRREHPPCAACDRAVCIDHVACTGERQGVLIQGSPFCVGACASVVLHQMLSEAEARLAWRTDETETQELPADETMRAIVEGRLR